MGLQLRFINAVARYITDNDLLDADKKDVKIATFCYSGYTDAPCYEDENGNLMIDIEDGVYPNRVEDQYINDKDEVIFEYYYNPMLYHDITFHADANGNLDYITVLTADAYWGTNAMYEANTTGFAILLILDVVIATGVYFIKSKKYK